MACKLCQKMDAQLTAANVHIQKLIEANERLSDKILALADARAYQAVHYDPPNPEDYYGGPQDEIISYDEHGGEVIHMRQNEPEMEKELKRLEGTTG